MAYTIEIHRHGAGKQPVATLRATDFAYVHSTAGGSNFNITAKDYLAQHFNSVRVGDWAVVRRSGATAESSTTIVVKSRASSMRFDSRAFIKSCSTTPSDSTARRAGSTERRKRG